MKKYYKDTFKGTLIVPVILVLVLLPFSLLIGWNLITMFVFWFLIIPGLAIYFPMLVSDNKNHLFESVMGLLIFYAVMVFMIYDHYKTDYFRIMVFSCTINLILISAITMARKLKAGTIRD